MLAQLNSIFSISFHGCARVGLRWEGDGEVLELGSYDHQASKPLPCFFSYGIQLLHLQVPPLVLPAQFFEREIEILATIRHPNVVGFIGACHQPPNVCLVTEFCARGSLDHLLHKSGVYGYLQTMRTCSGKGTKCTSHNACLTGALTTCKSP